MKINCSKVYDSGVYYQNASNEIVSIQKNLDAISNNIDENLGGAAGNNFIVSLRNHIGMLDSVVNFLGDYGDLLKKVALEHGSNDGNFVTRMERSELDER